MKHLLVNVFILILIVLLVSCSTSTMVATGNQKKNKAPSVDSYNKRYKHMGDCEEKFMKRFNRLYAKQQRKTEMEEISTPFFSTKVNSKQ